VTSPASAGAGHLSFVADVPGADKHPLHSQIASIGAGLFPDERLHGWPLVLTWLAVFVVSWGLGLGVVYLVASLAALV